MPGVTVGDALGCGVGLGFIDCVALGLGERVVEGEGEAVRVALGDADGLLLTEGDGDGDSVGVGSVEAASTSATDGSGSSATSLGPVIFLNAQTARTKIISALIPNPISVFLINCLVAEVYPSSRFMLEDFCWRIQGYYANTRLKVNKTGIIRL